MRDFKQIELVRLVINEGLEKNILDEYHMFDFSRNINDHNFIFTEYNRLLNKINMIFISKN
jgi:hypothetical protein